MKPWLNDSLAWVKKKKSRFFFFLATAEHPSQILECKTWNEGGSLRRISDIYTERVDGLIGETKTLYTMPYVL